MEKPSFLIIFFISFLSISIHAQDHKITIQKNSTVFIEYLSPAVALLDEDNFTLEMTSLDQKHSLVLNLFPFGREEYPLNTEGIEGGGVLMLLSDKLGTPLTFDTGIFKLLQSEANRFSFSLSGKKNTGPDAYSVEINLDNIPLRKL